jgi:hypothetical protein
VGWFRGHWLFIIVAVLGFVLGSGVGLAGSGTDTATETLTATQVSSPKPETVTVKRVRTVTHTVTETETETTPTDEPTEPVPTEPGCDENYSGCVPVDSDVDCEGGSGDGPSYVAGPVDVIGEDIYDLDRDGNGIACE